MKQHIKANQTDDNPSNFIGLVIKQVQDSDDPQSAFNAADAEGTVFLMLLDLYLSGTETNSTSLLWFFLYIAKYTHIQKTIQQEIDSVVLRGNLPLLEHKNRSIEWISATNHVSISVIVSRTLKPY